MMSKTDCGLLIIFAESSKEDNLRQQKALQDMGLSLEELADAFRRIEEAASQGCSTAEMIAAIRKAFEEPEPVIVINYAERRMQLRNRLRKEPLFHTVLPRRKYAERLCCVKHFV